MKKTKSKLFASLLVGTLLLSGVVQGSSLITKVTSTINEEITIEWNGEKFTPKEDNGVAVHPLVYKGRTYLPVRFIAERAGIDVGWEQSSRTITLNQNAKQRNKEIETEDNDLINKNIELEKQVKELQKDNNNLKSQNKDADYINQIENLNIEITNLKDKNKIYEDREIQQKKDRDSEFNKATEESIRLQKELQEKRDEIIRNSNNGYGQTIGGDTHRPSPIHPYNPKPIPREVDHNYIDGQGQIRQGTGGSSIYGDGRGGSYINGRGQKIWK